MIATKNGHLSVAADGEVFPNACIADCLGATDYEVCDIDLPPFPPIDGGDSSIIILPPGGELPCGCDFELDPVCTEDGQFFPNACFAECLGVTDYEPCTP